jgi:hypothetical protein
VPHADRIGVIGKDDGNCLRRLPGGLDLRRRVGEDDINRYTTQLGRERRQLIDLVRPTEFDSDGLTLNPTESAQSIS